MATKRAKRLAKYLEEELDWSVFPPDGRCTKCQGRCQRDYNFCPNCGVELTKGVLETEDDLAYNDLEVALKYALDHKNKSSRR